MRCPREILRSLPCVALLALTVPATAAPGQDLSFEERVQATEAILRVYHAHQLDGRQPFEADVPHAAIEDKVRRTVEQSLALDQLWHSPITGEMLRAEWERVE